MNNGNRGFAIASGIFLLLYGGVIALFSLLWFPGLLVLCNYQLPAAAGLFLILRKPKIAAVLMTLALVVTLVLELPEIPRYLEPNGYLATYDEAIGYTEYIPRAYVVLPILSILAAACFAAALYLQGWPALVLAVLAAGTELTYMVLQIQSTGYVTGHPTPLNVMFPFNYAMGALFAGLYLFSLRKNRRNTKDTGNP